MVLERVDAAAPAPLPVEPDATAAVRTHDGVRLATDIYCPKVAGARRFPTLLLRTPYGKRGTIDRIGELAAFFTAANVAVVVQDVRGKFASDGDVAPFRHEVADGHATAQWVSEQPWSNGSVVPFGDSYAGLTSWATAASGHPAVRAAIVRVTTSHLPDEWMYRQGAFRLQQNAQWATFAWTGRELDDTQPDWSRRPLADIVGTPRGGAGSSQLHDWLKTAPMSPRWNAILGFDPPLSQRVQVPVLHWGGWWDLMARGQVREWQSLATARRAPQQLVMGATDHSFNPFSCVDGAAANASFEHQYSRIADFITAACGVGDGAGNAGGLSSIRWELTNGTWFEGDSWPPGEAVADRLYLADGQNAACGPEGGALASVPDRAATSITLPHDPADLVPSLETWVWGTLASDYPDERDVHVRPDVMTFSGPPAGQPVDIVGPVTLRVAQQAPADGAQITGVLSDVYPDGRARRIAEGAVDLRAGVPAGAVDIDLGPIAYRVRIGHRLRIALAASAFPRYLWHATDRVAALRASGGTQHEVTVRVGSDSYLEAHYLRRKS